MSTSALMNQFKELGGMLQKDSLNSLQERAMGSMKNILSGKTGAEAKEKIVASTSSSTKPQVAEGTKSQDLQLAGLQFYQNLGVKAYANC